MFPFPQIMGVVNVTPDSFSDGGLFFTAEKAVKHAIELHLNGADILDIGGESSRPGAEAIPADEEIRRVVPVIGLLRKEAPNATISIDSTKRAVVSAALNAGAGMINDISCLRDPGLAEMAASYDVPLVIMHMQGTPSTMQVRPEYNDVVQEVFMELQKNIRVAQSLGVKKIYADVGIGFGKTVEHNWELLREHSQFKKLGVPLLLGISRKSFIGKTLSVESPTDRDIATAMLHALLLHSGAEILRVHTIQYLSQVKTMAQHLQICQ